MKKTIENFDLKDKKVIIRVDFNVPIKNGEIQDDNRIKQSLETIEYAVKKQAKVILLSHLGRVKTEEDKVQNTLEPVALRLSELLNQEVIFVTETHGELLEQEVDQLRSGEILLVENTRFEDLNGKKESSNDPELGKYWASLGDIFINDAFGTCHRSHASNVGIASHLPNGIGFLVKKELENLDVKKMFKPITVILGGSKVSDKIGVIQNLVNVADTILIGGGMAYTFLKASDIEIGKSILDEENLQFCKEILRQYPDKIILPIDSVNATEMTDQAIPRTCFINEIKDNEIGLDIGPQTLKLFKSYLENANTILWNGPVGMFELDAFSSGTKGICKILKDLTSKKIVGGGDTGSAIKNLGYEECVDYISTGGGASLELLEGKKLPGIEVIEDQ